MNTRVLIKKTHILLVLSIVFAASCKKEVEEQQVYDNVIYEIDSTRLYSSSADKTKQKTPSQYISIMFSDLFSYGIGQTDLTELAELSLSLGDKSMANEIILSHYLNDPTVNMPTDAEMRADVETFINNTYRLFFQRIPMPYERIYLRELIDKDPGMGVEEIYIAFILSNEYYYY